MTQPFAWEVKIGMLIETPGGNGRLARVTSTIHSHPDANFGTVTLGYAGGRWTLDAWDQVAVAQ